MLPLMLSVYVYVCVIHRACILSNGGDTEQNNTMIKTLTVTTKTHTQW